MTPKTGEERVRGERVGFAGRVALVTGGTGNLGRAVVQRFRDGGARVHVPEVDLTDPAAVEAVVRTVRESEGRSPEILLNLAGGFAMAPVEETTPETWSRMWGMNATTAFLASRAVFPGMREAGWGRLVNVSAFPAIDRGKAGLSAYAAAKAAVLSLTHTLAREGASAGITVNAVLPSIIDTPPNRAAMPNADTSAWLPPAEIAEVIAFLASEEARIVNGAAIPLTLDP